MALVVEITYDSAAGLRGDWESRLKAGAVSVAGAFREEPAPFADVMLILIVAGGEAVRVPGIVTAASERETLVEVAPESRAFLATALAPFVESGARGGSEVKRARLFDEAPPANPSDLQAFVEAPTERYRPEVMLADQADTRPIARNLVEPQSADKRIAALSVGEKVRLAMHGSREERVWLAKERAGAVQASLVRNPRITVDEVLALARAPHLAPDAVEAMMAHPSYGNSAQIAVALVRNPRTPIPFAVELIGKLQPHDLRVIAKGLNVRAPIAQAARKKLHNVD